MKSRLHYIPGTDLTGADLDNLLVRLFEDKWPGDYSCPEQPPDYFNTRWCGFAIAEQKPELWVHFLPAKLIILIFMITFDVRELNITNKITTLEW
jgi:hypothetical protein